MANIHLQVVRDWRDDPASVSSIELLNNAKSALTAHKEDREVKILRLVADASAAAYKASLSESEADDIYAEETFNQAIDTINIDPQFPYKIYQAAIRGKQQLNFITQINNTWQ
jgi:hypothetical protein